MVILIDPSDEQLFVLMKAISDSGYEDIEEEHTLLMKLIEQKGRKIQIDYQGENDIRISFPKKKKLGIF